MDHGKGVAVDFIARKIAGYFREYPNAADTADGVFKWWLSRERVRCTHKQVESALEYLVAEGSVVKTKLADGRTLYSCIKTDRD